MKFPFGDWLPDVAELDTATDAGPICAVARNVYPGANSYLPIPGADTPYATALDAAPRGLYMVQKEDGSFKAFAGTQSKLFEYVAAVPTSRGTGYSVPDDEQWSFAQFGTNLIATNFTDGPQVIDIEAGTSFAALTGSPPTARFVDVIEDYVVLASLGTDPFGIAWSDTNDATEWSTGNSGSQTFPDGGRVQNFSGSAGLVIQERAVRQMIHTPGSAEVFQFTKVADARGTIAPYSVIKFGDKVGYLAEDGFWFEGVNIGANKMNSYFFSRVDRSRLFSVKGAFDPTRPIFYWVARTTEANTYDFGVMFNWKSGRWSELDFDLTDMANIATPGVTLEELAVAYPDLETVPYSLDSRVWQGGRPVFAIIDTDYRLAFLEGDNLEATIETGERELSSGRRSMVRSVRPLVDSTAAVVAVGRRSRQGDSFSWSSESTMQTSGRCPVKADGRYHRFRVRVPAGSVWTHAAGVDVDASPSGVR
jgi:hypothetical protein